MDQDQLATSVGLSISAWRKKKSTFNWIVLRLGNKQRKLFFTSTLISSTNIREGLLEDSLRHVFSLFLYVVGNHDLFISLHQKNPLADLLIFVSAHNCTRIVMCPY